MGLRPVIKAKNSRQKVAEWLVGRLPPTYREMCYIEPFLGDGSVLLAKDPSAEEVVSDSDLQLMSVWRALRDEPAAFSSRVKRMSHSKATFQRCHKALGGDYMDEAIREFSLRHMSRGAEKSVYICRPDEPKCGDCWCGIFDRIPEVNERVGGVFMLNREALEVIKAFDHENAVVFCDPPALDAENSDYHSEIGSAMNDFRGKALILARNTAMYRRIYSEWNRKGVTGGGNESLWTNF
jgi:DNA adenine methylase